MSNYLLDFESPLKEIEDRINTLKNTSVSTGVDVEGAIEKLEEELKNKRNEIYSNLTRWHRVQLARHPKRPHSSDYIELICDYWLELHGDRLFADDPAIISGIGRLDSIKVVIIAQEKGRHTKDKVYRNFGMPKPEGYRKALRIMKIAEKYKLPIVTLLDTPGAYPGIGAEERGQAQAIANNLFNMANIKAPIISIIIGEGASGGALGIGLGDRIICFENTWYSVISPEGCASILFRDSNRAAEAADAMKVTAKDLFDMGIADSIIPEPNGSAHLDINASAEILKETIIRTYSELKQLTTDELLSSRLKKYEAIGDWKEE